MNDFKKAIRPAIPTFVFVFIGTVGPQLLGWVQPILDAVDSGEAIEWPEFSTLGTIFIGGTVATGTAFLNFLFRYAQQKGLITGQAPEYKPVTPKGQ